MTPPTVNAYYDPQMNDINFPAGVLQPPLYDPKMDDAPNYGNTGSTIGHELTHGFDDEGRQFDAQGNLKDWWTPADAKAFDERDRLRARSVRAVHDHRRHQDQLEADLRRRRRRSRRNAAGVHRLEGSDGERGPRSPSTATRPTSASSSASRSGPARASVPRTSASTPSPTRTPPAVPHQRHRLRPPEFRKRSSAGRTSRWCGRKTARSGEDGLGRRLPAMHLARPLRGLESRHAGSAGEPEGGLGGAPSRLLWRPPSRPHSLIASGFPRRSRGLGLWGAPSRARSAAPRMFDGRSEVPGTASAQPGPKAWAERLRASCGGRLRGRIH